MKKENDNDPDLYIGIQKYKNELIESKDSEKQKAFDEGNRVDERLSSHLIFISAGILTIIGGLISSGNQVEDGAARALLTVAIILLVVSIGFGILDYQLKSSFFEKWGYFFHTQGARIYDDDSENLQELHRLMGELRAEDSKMPTKAPVLPRILQVTLFIISSCLLTVLVIASIYH